MSRKRFLHCSNPNCPHENQKQMSDWIREKLPDSNFGYMVSDLDFILQNYKTKKVMLIEVKTRKSDCKIWQKKLFKNINNWLKKGIDENWQYLGFHLIQFENTCFKDGKSFFDYKEITENELIKKLNF